MAKTLLSMKIDEFIEWLEANTDFGDWDTKLRLEVAIKLRQIMEKK